MPEPKWTLGVYRRLDNRSEGLADNSPRALELHNRRRDALHEALGGRGELVVLDWGDTDDVQSHEYVELIIAATGSAVFRYAVVPGLKWLGKKLAENAVDAAASETVKAIVSWLRGTQEAKKILDFTLTLPNGMRVSVDPPDGRSEISVVLKNGAVESFSYRAIGD